MESGAMSSGGGGGSYASYINQQLLADEEPSGTYKGRGYIDNIERTPAYQDFIKKLEAHHSKLGTLLQKEPILGARKMDLLRCYNAVIQAGGYHAASRERQWKEIAFSVGIPRTLTNAPYVFKEMYKKYLWTFEQEHFWHQTPITGKGNDQVDGPWNFVSIRALSTSSLNIENFPESNIAKRQRITYGYPESYLVPQTMVSNVPGSQSQSRISRYLVNEEDEAEEEEDEDVIRAPPPHIQPVRILQALKSNLPNETDWAYNCLLEYSFHGFSLRQHFDIMDLVSAQARLDAASTTGMHAVSVSDSVNAFSNKESFISDGSKRLKRSFWMTNERRNAKTERVLQVITILRNLSFFEVNRRDIANDEAWMGMIRCGVMFLVAELTNLDQSDDGTDGRAEFGRLCLDTLENIAWEVELRNMPLSIDLPEFLLFAASGSGAAGTLTTAGGGTRECDLLVLQLLRLLQCQQDRYLCVTALRVFTRLYHNEKNWSGLNSVSPAINARVKEMCLVTDDFMQWAAIDWLYQWSLVSPGEDGKWVAGRMLEILEGEWDESWWEMFNDETNLGGAPTVEREEEVDMRMDSHSPSPSPPLSPSFTTPPLSTPSSAVPLLTITTTPTAAIAATTAAAATTATTTEGVEPQSAAEWLRATFIHDVKLSDGLILPTVYIEYRNMVNQARIAKMRTSSIAASSMAASSMTASSMTATSMTALELSPAEFVNVVKQAFPQAELLPQPDAEQLLVVRGLKRIDPGTGSSGVVGGGATMGGGTVTRGGGGEETMLTYCMWRNCNIPITDPQGLDSHLKQIHLTASLDSYRCDWRGCGRLFKKPAAWRKISSHIRTHTLNPMLIRVKRPNLSDITAAVEGVATAGKEAEEDGIQITASLVLRNLARNAQTRPWLQPLESRLVLLLTRVLEDPMAIRVHKILDLLNDDPFLDQTVDFI